MSRFCRRFDRPGDNLINLSGHRLKIPSHLQGPALELTDEEIGQTLFATERSLGILKKSFGKSRIVVVHIPSPLSSYSLAGERVSIQSYEKRGTDYSAVAVRKRSLNLCRRLVDMTRRLRIGFFDSRPAVRIIAGLRLVHGPRDWKHLNRAGYEALGRGIASYLRQPESHVPCRG